MTTVKKLWDQTERSLDEQSKDILQTNAVYTITDATGIISYANANYCRIVGYTMSELVGEPNRLLQTDQLNSLKRLKLWQALLQGNTWEGILKGTSKKGKTFWLKSKIIPFDPDVHGHYQFLSIHEDITNLKSRSETIKNDTAMYRHIYDSVKIGIVIVLDSSGNIIKWNKGAERAFGFSSFEILGKPFSGLMGKKYNKTNFKDFLRLLERFKKASEQEVLELYCVNGNGGEFPVEFVLSKWEINGSMFYGVKMLDITKRMAFQNRLKQKSKELEVFLYRSAHDLNTPFASAQGLINLMKEEPQSEKMEELIGMLEKTIDHAKVLSNGLATASLVSTLNAERKEIDFERIMEDVMHSLRGEDNLENIRFSVDIQETQGFASNPSLIFTIFQNLLQNAIKYTGGVSKRRLPSIQVLVTSENQEIILRVSDNGAGIKKQSLDKIFELYYRAEVERAPGSNGLGLYIVKKIVDSLNGSIQVESKVNKGTTFEIRLPKPSKSE